MKTVHAQISVLQLGILIAVSAALGFELTLNILHTVITGNPTIVYPHWILYFIKFGISGYVNLIVMAYFLPRFFTAEDYEASKVGDFLRDIVPFVK